MKCKHSAVSRSFAGLACLAALLLAPALFAGDEDMSPSAYHVFDPETGYMMTVDPMAEEQIVDADAAAGKDAADTAVATSGQRTGGPTLSQLLIYATVTLLLVGGIIVWRRNQGKAV